MHDIGLFTDQQMKPRRKVRTSPRKRSHLAFALVSAMSPQARARAAREVIALLSGLGMDRMALAAEIGLSRSSTSHWFHGANSISRHNLAVLLDIAAERARPARDALHSLAANTSPWCTHVLQDQPREITEVDLLSERLRELEATEAKAAGPAADKLVMPTKEVAAKGAMMWDWENGAYRTDGALITEFPDHTWWLEVKIGIVIEIQFPTLAEAFASAHAILGTK